MHGKGMIPFLLVKYGIQTDDPLIEQRLPWPTAVFNTQLLLQSVVLNKKPEGRRNLDAGKKRQDRKVPNRSFENVISYRSIWLKGENHKMIIRVALPRLVIMF